MILSTPRKSQISLPTMKLYTKHDHYKGFSLCNYALQDLQTWKTESSYKMTSKYVEQPNKIKPKHPQILAFLYLL